jgi:multidrug efflux pump subunit AcrA (membrane-fusion protein)
VQRVTFDERGAEQVSLRTATVRRQGKRTVVPYAALIYDGQGASWVYTSPDPLTFVRVAVDVVRIEDDRVLLRDGPRPGTSVVTTGAAEVYGAELEIAGGH